MCRNSVLVVTTKRPSKQDENTYAQEVKKEIFSSGKTLKDGEFKVEVSFIDHNGHIDYQSKKGSHIKRVVFDLGGFRDEGKTIANVKKGLAKVNKVENPLMLRISTGDNLHGCKSISKLKHVACDFAD